MSYVVFARKWRPLTFDDVVGQEHITETLKKAIEKNRVAHAYIFTGTRGVGKTTTARIMARALNCDNGPTANPCSTCPSCKNILSGSSFDVLEIDGASNNSVDDIRELRDNIGYSSMGGKYRIFVIDEVHMLTKSAFNALLKTLEEPPKNVIFIFATTEPQKIPATIHSRCQRYDFKRIGAEQILGRLIDVCTKENITFEKSALMLVARKAEGSMRDSMSLLDQVYSFCQENLTEKEVRKVLGLVGLDVYTTVMDAIAAKTPVPALKTVQDVLYQGFDLQEFLLGLQDHIRNLLFARIPGALEARGVELEHQEAQKFIESAQRFSEGDLLRMSEIVKKAEADLKWSTFPRFHVEITILKLVFLDSTVSIEKLLALAGNSVPPGDINSQMQVLQSTSVENESPESKKKITESSVPDSTAVLIAAEEIKPVEPGVQPHLTEEVTVPIINESETIDNSFGESIEPDETDDDSDEEDNIDEVAAVKVEQPGVPVVQEQGPDSGEQGLKERWSLFMDYMLKDRPNLGSFLALGFVASATDTSIDIKFPSTARFQFMEITKKQNRNEIEQLLTEFLSKKIDLHITVDTKKPDLAEQEYLRQIAQVPSTINDEIEREPIIKTVLDMFDGEILN